MRFRYTFFLILFFSTTSWINISGQGWEVPADQKIKVAPIKFSAEMQKQGEALYLKNCQSCHGIPGKDNWARLTPPPGDLAAGKAQKQTDGELFFRITTGKIPMPEFRNILTTEERWTVIAYLRSYNPKYIQPEPQTQTGLSAKKVRMRMDFDKNTNKIVVRVTEFSQGNTEIPFKNAEVLLFVKRYFGNLQIADPKITGDHGIVAIDFPVELPGDKLGNIELTALVKDPEGKLSGAKLTQTMQIGVPADAPSLIAKRAWWATRDKAPVWVILTYSLAVFLVWGFILKILVNILKIRKIK